MSRAASRADATEPPPEPDRLPGVPHPRDTAILYGQQAAEAAFLQARATGRLHHGWLLTGRRGIGKATLAWRIARALLADAPRLDVPGDHPVARRMAAGAEPRLFVLRRPVDDKTGRLRQETTVDEVRRLKSFFGLSAADGGMRVAIVDAADDMNTSAANALLKLLEEPPPHAVLLLVAHQPAALLPTIRSRCRELRLARLGPQDLALAVGAALAGAATGPDAGPAPGLGPGFGPGPDATAMAELADGSVGDAVSLLARDGAEGYAMLVELCDTMPRLDRHRAVALADGAAAGGADDRFELMVGLIDLLLARLARAAATRQLPPEAAPGESRLLTRLGGPAGAALAWADLQQGLGNRARRARAVNLDPAALLMDMVLRMNQTAARVLAR